MKVKRIAVIGSRTAHIDAEALAAYIFSDAIIISGGAKGADTIAETFAISHNLPITIYKPDYKKHGKAAPLIRNRMIIDNCDQVIAIWDGISKGTKFTLDYAKKQGKPIEIISI